MPAKFQLHLITEAKRSPADLAVAVAGALEGGADWVQLRDKSGSALAVFKQAAELRRLCRAAGARLSINDRLDVALAVGADGVHLAAQSLPVASAIEVAQPRLLVGRSVHALDEAVEAAAAGAGYLTFGHVYPSTSKPGLPPRGVADLARIVEAVDCPVLAIGGVNLDNLADVLATGCAGIAVISAILSSANPREAAAELRAALDASPHQPKHPFPREVSHAAHRESATV